MKDVMTGSAPCFVGDALHAASGTDTMRYAASRPTKNAADPPPTSQSEALENLERRSVSPGTKKARFPSSYACLACEWHADREGVMADHPVCLCSEPGPPLSASARPAMSVS